MRDLDLETTQKGNSLGGEGFLPKGNPPGEGGFLSIDMLYMYLYSTHLHAHTRTSRTKLSNCATYHRVAKTHRMPCLYRSHSAKEP